MWETRVSCTLGPDLEPHAELKGSSALSVLMLVSLRNLRGSYALSVLKLIAPRHRELDTCPFMSQRKGLEI